MSDPRSVTAHFGPARFPGRILALEGGGYMRVRLEGAPHPWPEVGHQGEMEMHDGARFGVVVTERLGAGPEGAQKEDTELRVKLVDRGG